MDTWHETDLAIFRTGEEKVWRALRNNALSPISMTPIDSGVSVGLIEPSSVGEEVTESPASGAGGEGGTRGIRLSRAGVLEVKDTDF